MRAAQVVVAHLHPCVHCTCVDGRIDLRLAGVRGIKDYGSGRLFEYATHSRDCEMAYRKLGSSVRRINLPGLSLCRARRREHKNCEPQELLHKSRSPNAGTARLRGPELDYQEIARWRQSARRSAIGVLGEVTQRGETSGASGLPAVQASFAIIAFASTAVFCPCAEVVELADTPS